MRALSFVLAFACLGGCDSAADGQGDSPDAAPGDGAAPALVRLMHGFKPGFVRVDYFFGRSDGSWVGPLYAGRYGWGDGWSQNMSSYAEVPPGAYTLRLVSVTSENCETPMEGIADLALPHDLVSAAHYSVAITGDFMADTATARMFDDEAAPATAGGRLRVVNLAEVTGAIDLYHINVNTPPGPGQVPGPVFMDVAYGAVGSAAATNDAGASDANGYVDLPAGDGYFYYNLPLTAAGGNVEDPLLRFHETDGFLLSGSWTLFLVNNVNDGALRYTMCLDDGDQTTTHCTVR